MNGIIIDPGYDTNNILLNLKSKNINISYINKKKLNLYKQKEYY